MPSIQGYGVHAAGAELLPFRYDAGELCPQDVEVRITHCGVCHSDLHLIDNDWGISQYPFIPGHEIVGTVVEAGEAVRHLGAGDRVGVGWQADSCGFCEWCRKGEENLCAQIQATCVGRHGGYAEAVRVNARFAVKLPQALDSETAAPLLCAGITVYRPLRIAGVNPSSRVGVIGIGGLGHLALQFSRAFGAEVTAFSTSVDKETEAMELGAHHFVHSRDSKALKAVEGTQDLILSTINAAQEWSSYVSALRPHGTLCLVGVPPKPVAVDAFPLIAGARCICGSNTGSPARIVEMLDVAARHNVAARTETFRMAEANEAISRLRKNQIRYRAVLAN
ncbi:MAG TPA: NAD(P)-dependent alcohol dehydrogenase [Acidobacteriaceae bacterium]|nr:NAD(P)-dependent alcohol dehydrogenase [Acidobacteriaceae bacterium]